ncbi:hypothetical protein HOO68_02050 [Candidatus Gracilibacteria bacterium]|nr:hypothetical protein [Candidatus Gracilibacteria bacterium]
MHKKAKSHTHTDIPVVPENISQIPVISKSVFLTKSVKFYTKEVLPEHRNITPSGLSGEIDHFILKNAEQDDDEILAIALLGFPAVGKSSTVPRILHAVQDALGFQEPQEHIVYKRANDAAILEVGSYVCQTANAIVTLLHTDHFFHAIGSDRRGIMLKDIETCRKYWGKLRAAFRFLRNLYAGKVADIRIYTGTVDEKIQKEPKGTIELKVHPDIDTKKVVVIEGVNAGEWVDRIKRRMSIKILKILYNMSIEDSLIRVLRRDHEKKGLEFQTIVNERLLEYYFIFEIYILPALRNPKTVLFNKSRDVPPFTEDEKLDILAALHIARAMYLRTTSNITPEQKKFIDILSSRVIDQIQQLNPVSVEVLERGKMQKLGKTPR